MSLRSRGRTPESAAGRQAHGTGTDASGETLSTLGSALGVSGTTRCVTWSG